MKFLHRTVLALNNRKTLCLLVKFISFGYKHKFNSAYSIHVNKVGSQKPLFVEMRRFLNRI